MLEQLEYDDKLLNIISNKLSDAIMNNETFRQIVCDAVSLEVKEKIESLENLFNWVNQETNFWRPNLRNKDNTHAGTV